MHSLHWRSLIIKGALLALTLFTVGCLGGGSDSSSNAPSTEEEDPPTTTDPNVITTGSGNGKAALDLIKLGICRSDLAWLGNWSSQQEVILDQIKSAGVSRVRLTLHHDRQLSTVVNQVKYCNFIGLEVNLVLLFTTDALLYPSGSVRRGGGQFSFDVYPLSQIDLNLTRGWLANIIGTLSSSGAQLAALEVDNEPNWVDFNGDFSLVSGGKIYDLNSSYSSLGSIPQGAQKLGEIYRQALNQVRSSYGGSVPVLLGGLNKVPERFTSATSASHITPEGWLRLMQGTFPGQPSNATNYLPSVEAFAYHFYPLNGFAQTSTVRTRASEYLTDFMLPVLEVTGRSRPIYITEFGYAAENFASDDSQRADVMGWFFDAMAEDPNLFDLDWREIWIYSWDDPPFQMSNNGQPMPAMEIFQRFAN